MRRALRSELTIPGGIEQLVGLVAGAYRRRVLARRWPGAESPAYYGRRLGRGEP